MATRVYESRINWRNSPSPLTPLGESNLNKMDYALYEHDISIVTLDNNKANASDVIALTNAVDSLAYSKADKSSLATKADKSELANKADKSELSTKADKSELVYKANQSDLLNDIKTVTYDNTTGVWKFTHQNGIVNTFDQNIEKIPISFSMSPQGIITMKTADGTKYTADIASLINVFYVFKDTSTIDFTTTVKSNGTKEITATILPGSITDSMIQPHYLADIKVEAQSAQLHATLSQSYAIGGTGKRSGENTDNSKYYSEQAAVSETHVQQMESRVQNLHSDTVIKHDETVVLKQETQDLFNNTQTEIDTILANVFDNVNPAAYVDITTGELMYQAGGKLNFIVDEVPGSATEGDLLWEVI